MVINEQLIDTSKCHRFSDNFVEFLFRKSDWKFTIFHKLNVLTLFSLLSWRIRKTEWTNRWLCTAKLIQSDARCRSHSHCSIHFVNTSISDRSHNQFKWKMKKKHLFENKNCCKMQFFWWDNLIWLKIVKYLPLKIQRNRSMCENASKHRALTKKKNC